MTSTDFSLAKADPRIVTRAGLFVTAFIAGAAGLFIEVVGARALAPYFGSSLRVWTAQITATLLFLALGYELGGRLSIRPHSLQVPTLLSVAGVCLGLYSKIRSAVLLASSGSFGVAAGSFFSSAGLFGVPLLCLGAVSPLLVGHIDRSRPGAGTAAGSLFFISTLGGLAGGWITAFVVIPHFSVRISLGVTGGLLALLGAAWALAAERMAPALACAAASLGALALGLPPRPITVPSPSGMPVTLAYTRQSDVGLLQVIDLPSPRRRALLIDGVLQGGTLLDTGRSFLDFSGHMNRLAERFHPHARDALILGLGAGLLANDLDRRGLRVAAVEIDPEVVEVARRFFDLSPGVETHVADARTYLRANPTERYDLVFLDVFAAENLPWYLTTAEALSEMALHLRSGGRLLINTVTTPAGDSPGLARLEASLRCVFPDVRVFVESGDPEVVNAVLVAGRDLPTDPDSAAHSGKSDAAPSVDDWSDLDYADSTLRLVWRKSVLADLGPEVLGD